MFGARHRTKSSPLSPHSKSNGRYFFSCVQKCNCSIGYSAGRLWLRLLEIAALQLKCSFHTAYPLSLRETRDTKSATCFTSETNATRIILLRLTRYYFLSITHFRLYRPSSSEFELVVDYGSFRWMARLEGMYVKCLRRAGAANFSIFASEDPHRQHGAASTMSHSSNLLS